MFTAVLRISGNSTGAPKGHTAPWPQHNRESRVYFLKKSNKQFFFSAMEQFVRCLFQFDTRPWRRTSTWKLNSLFSQSTWRLKIAPKISKIYHLGEFNYSRGWGHGWCQHRVFKRWSIQGIPSPGLVIFTQSSQIFNLCNFPKPRQGILRTSSLGVSQVEVPSSSIRLPFNDLLESYHQSPKTCFFSVKGSKYLECAGADHATVTHDSPTEQEDITFK